MRVGARREQEVLGQVLLVPYAALKTFAHFLQFFTTAKKCQPDITSRQMGCSRSQ